MAVILTSNIAKSKNGSAKRMPNQRIMLSPFLGSPCSPSLTLRLITQNVLLLHYTGDLAGIGEHRVKFRRLVTAGYGDLRWSILYLPLIHLPRASRDRGVSAKLCTAGNS